MKSCCETQTRMKFLCFADTMFCSILKKLFSLSGTSLTKQVSFFGLISSLVLATLCYSFCHCFGKGHVTFHFLAKILILLTPSDLISQNVTQRPERKESPLVQHLYEALEEAETHDGASMGDSYSLSRGMPAKLCHHTSDQQDS